MNRSPDGDVFWSDVRRHVTGTAPADGLSLAEAEHRLSTGGADPIPAQRIDAIVHAATRVDLDVAPPRTRLATWSRVAALFLVSIAIAFAAGGHRAFFPTAEPTFVDYIHILERTPEPADDRVEIARSRSGAAIRVFKGIQYGIDSLREMRPVPGRVGASIPTALTRLVVAVRGGGDTPEVDAQSASPEQIAGIALEAGRPDDERLAAIDALTGLVVRGVLALQRVPEPDPALAGELVTMRDSIANQLSR